MSRPLPMMSDERAGPRDPADSTPALPAGGRRRTAHVEVGPRGDAAWTDTVMTLEIRGAVRDVVHDPGRSEVAVLDAADMDAVLDDDRNLVQLDLTPDVDTSSVLGGPVTGGFRGDALELVDHPGAPAGVLLRDLPTAIVILAGYARMRSLQQSGVPGGKLTPPELLGSMADICSGWRSDGVMAESIRAGRGVPFQDCPTAPDLGDGWHDLGALAADWMRRRRRLDLVPTDDGYHLDAMFRDSFAAPGGDEEVLHEYGIEAELDHELVIRRMVARPHVLPFVECPWAADSVGALAGTHVEELRPATQEHLSGRAGCTHMNDLIVAIADLPHLLTEVAA